MKAVSYVLCPFMSSSFRDWRSGVRLAAPIAEFPSPLWGGAGVGVWDRKSSRTKLAPQRDWRRTDTLAAAATDESRRISFPKASPDRGANCRLRLLSPSNRD